MKIPSYCPFCNDPLKYDEFPGIVETRLCNKRIDHNIKFISHIRSEEIRAIHILLEPKTKKTMIWDFEDKEAKIRKIGHLESIELPWFDPDLSDFKKLMKKIKTYAVFS